MIKLVVSDIDGTLLRRGKYTLEPETLELVKKLQERGIMFAAASGRQYTNLYRMFEGVGSHMFYISENGGLVMHQEKRYKKSIIERSTGLEIIKDIIAISNAEVMISGERTSYILPKKKSFVDFLIHQIKNDITVISSPEQINEEFIKISLFMQDNEKVPEEVEEYLRNQYCDKLQVLISGIEWLDFIPVDAGKGNALKFLLEIMEILPEDIMVFGDNENDITMLSLTPNSYVMSHSAEQIKQYGAKECRYVDDILISLLQGSSGQP